jgi:hypothetical protein
MEISIDKKTKKISLDGPVNLAHLSEAIKKLFPDSWEEFDIECTFDYYRDVNYQYLSRTITIHGHDQ